MKGRLLSLILISALSGIAACSSDEKHEHLNEHCCDAAQVTTARTAATSSHDPEDRRGRTSEPTAAPPAPAPTARGKPGSGPRDVHADRERVIEEAAAEDRKSGGSEVVIEQDGVIYERGSGILPRYTVRTVDRKDAAPDPSVMKLVPGSNIDIPAPTPKPEPPKEQPSGTLVPTEVK